MDALDRQYHDLVLHVLKLEHWARVQDRLDVAVATTRHRCDLPGAGAYLFVCACGQRWVRELGGAWTTA